MSNFIIHRPCADSVMLRPGLINNAVTCGRIITIAGYLIYNSEMLGPVYRFCESEFRTSDCLVNIKSIVNHHPHISRLRLQRFHVRFLFCFSVRHIR